MPSIRLADRARPTSASRGFLRALSATSSQRLTTVGCVGRPRIYEEPRVATAIRLPISLRDELQSVAAERDVSVNLLVTRAVREYLGRLPPLGDAPPGPRRGAGRAGAGSPS